MRIYTCNLLGCELILDLLGDGNEGFLYVLSGAGACLEKVHAKFLGESLTLLGFDDLPIGEVALIADEHCFHVLSPVSVGLYLSDPVAYVVEGLLACAVVCHNHTLDISEVGLRNSPIALLPCSVPDLQLHNLSIYLDRLYLEIYPNGRDVRDVRVLICEFEKETCLSY